MLGGGRPHRTSGSDQPRPAISGTRCNAPQHTCSISSQGLRTLDDKLTAHEMMMPLNQMYLFWVFLLTTSPSNKIMWTVHW